MQSLDPIRPHLRWGLVGFGIAGVGVALSFLARAVDLRWAAVVAFAITAAGVAIGAVAVILGFARVVRLMIAPGRDTSSHSGPAA